MNFIIRLPTPEKIPGINRCLSNDRIKHGYRKVKKKEFKDIKDWLIDQYTTIK